MSRPSRTHAREGDGSPAIHRLDMTRFDLAAMVDILQLKTGVEVGVENGYFSYNLLKHSHLTTLWNVDSYEGRHVHYEAECRANLDEFGDRSRLVKLRSEQAAELAKAEGVLFDFVYIDAAHDEQSVRRDIEDWFQLTSRPCLFGGHDYIAMRNVGVVQAVNRFAARRGYPVYVTKEKWASWFFILGEDCRPGLTLLEQRDRHGGARTTVPWNVASGAAEPTESGTPPITFVHALWGDVLIRAYPKVLRDIQEAIAYNINWNAKPDCFDRMVFAYGVDNYRFLKAYGLKPIRLSHHPLVDFQGVGDRTHEGRNQKGEINFGYSLWQHKSHAIQQAFERGARQVIWLDWDTRINSADESLFALLQRGPEFQGRLRRYKKRQSGVAGHDVYHGGCYYAKTPRVFQEVDRLTPLTPHCTDEARVFIAVQNLFFNGVNAPVDEHRRRGFDNPHLYTTRGNSLFADVRTIFQEGHKISTPQFSKPLKSPPSEFVKYDVTVDITAPIAQPTTTE